MKNWPFQLGFAVLGILIAIVYWQFLRSQQPPGKVVIAPPVEQPASPPAIRHPVSTSATDLQASAPLIPPEQPLPSLKESDASMAAILAKLFTDQRLDRFFFLEHFIERFVVMVDNLPRQELPATHRPLKKLQGEFLTLGDRDNLTMDPDNAKRYAPLVRMLNALDRAQVVAVYRRLYPLFQEAYEQLGYPQGYFNDRLIEVIDHLLATPEFSGPIHLVQPKALYLYADPDLEAFSAGRKILLRCGPENAAQIKNLLRAYRELLTTQPP